MQQLPIHHHDWLAIWSAIVAFLGGGTVQRILVFISKTMPPIPDRAGFWAKWAYSTMKALSGLDPSAKIVLPTKS